MSQKPISIIVVDDHQLVRAGLRQTLGSEPDLRIQLECQSGREALAGLRKHPCHVLLLDLSLPDMSGLEVLAQARRKHPEVAVLIISGFPETQFGINVLRAGASGYVSKTVDAAELLRAVRMVARGHRYVGPELADLLVSGIDGSGDGPRHASLSEREFQIFCRLAKGDKPGEIARQLSLSVKTISTYRTRVLEKMGFRTNADLTTYALQNELISN
jgi:DNA-binding NarL/FixJ family response regulator